MSAICDFWKLKQGTISSAYNCTKLWIRTANKKHTNIDFSCDSCKNSVSYQRQAAFRNKGLVLSGTQKVVCTFWGDTRWLILWIPNMPPQPNTKPNHPPRNDCLVLPQPFLLALGPHNSSPPPTLLLRAENNTACIRTGRWWATQTDEWWKAGGEMTGTGVSQIIWREFCQYVLGLWEFVLDFFSSGVSRKLTMRGRWPRHHWARSPQKVKHTGPRLPSAHWKWQAPSLQQKE